MNILIVTPLRLDANPSLPGDPHLAPYTGAIKNLRRRNYQVSYLSPWDGLESLYPPLDPLYRDIKPWGHNQALIKQRVQWADRIVVTDCSITSRILAYSQAYSKPLIVASHNNYISHIGSAIKQCRSPRPATLINRLMVPLLELRTRWLSKASSVFLTNSGTNFEALRRRRIRVDGVIGSLRERAACWAEPMEKQPERVLENFVLPATKLPKLARWRSVTLLFIEFTLYLALGTHGSPLDHLMDRATSSATRDSLAN